MIPTDIFSLMENSVVIAGEQAMTIHTGPQIKTPIKTKPIVCLVMFMQVMLLQIGLALTIVLVLTGLIHIIKTISQYFQTALRQEKLMCRMH